MTEDDKALVKWLRDEAALAYDREDTNTLNETADRIEALIAEKEAARKEERTAIIAWLEKESALCDCAAIYDGECVCGALDECKTVPIERILLAIEAGKHLK